ncbi:MAG: extracellular solute-binding protein [Herpetosiphon sp.]
MARPDDHTGDPRVHAPISRRKFLEATGLAVSAMALAACGNAASPTAQATKIGATGAAATPETVATMKASITAAKAIIKVSYPDELGAKPKYVDAAAKEFNQANPGAEVRVDLQKIDSDSFYTKLLLALGAGDGPDVIHVGGDLMAELADANFIAPLDQYLNAWDDFKNYPDAIKKGMQYKGKTYAMPYGLDTRFLYYRKDVFATAGLPADWQPTKVQDIVDAAKQVKAKGGATIPYVLYAGSAGGGGTTSHAFLPLVWAYGGDLNDKDGKWIGSSPAILKALQYIQTVYQTEKLVPSEVLTLPKPWTTMRQKMGDGGLAILFEGGWVRGGWSSKQGDDQVTKTVGTSLFPYDNGQGTFTVGGLGTCWYITSQCKNKDLAWDFIRRWNNKDTVAKLNLEDPHPVARLDAAEVPEFKQNAYLIRATESLKSAKFQPVASAFGKVQQRIQLMTGRVATGEATPADAMKRFAEELKIIVGDDQVVVQA